MKRKRHFENFSTDDLRAELRREKYKQRYHRTLRNTILTLVVVAAFAVLVSTLWFPVMRIFGGSMTPTLQEGEIVVAVKTNTFQAGDIVGFLRQQTISEKIHCRSGRLGEYYRRWYGLRQ